MNTTALQPETWRPSRYHVLHYWSPVAGRRVGRFWMFDSRGAEYFAIVPMDGTGKQNKAARTRALEAIEQAIVNEDTPGQVQVSNDE